MAHPRDAMGLSAVCDCGISDFTHLLFLKILNNQTPVYLSDLLTYKSHSHSFRYTNTFETPQVRTSPYGVRSFRSTAAKIWNSLP